MLWGHDEQRRQVMPSWSLNSVLLMFFLSGFAVFRAHTHTHNRGGEGHGFWHLGDQTLDSGFVFLQPL